MDDFRGRVLRIIAGSYDEQTESFVDESTIFLVRQRAAKASGAACVSLEPDAWTAFAIILGRTPDDLAGWEILADQNAWLRATWHPNDAGDRNDLRALAAEIRNITAHPIPIVAASGHIHQH
jgi:hypothetical protein